MQNKNIYSYIKMISKKPWMYIWWNNLVILRSHIWGYLCCLWYKGIEEKEYPPFMLFHDYIWVKYWYYESTSWWSWMLIDKYWNTKEALDNFFEHLEEFKEKFWKMSKEEIIKYFYEKWYDVRGRFD
jgi:hypothetical protein